MAAANPNFPSSFPGSIWMPVPNADVFSSNAHAAIVIHKTASPPWSTAQAVAQGFINEAVGPSVHYVVGRDGTVIQCVSELSGAGGNCCLEAGHDPFWDSLAAQYGNLNLCTLSIEHVDTDPENQTPCTQAQLNASFALVLYLSQKWGIPPSNIKPHSSLDPISRANCPGNYPFQQLINFVTNGGAPTPQTPPPNANFDSEVLDCWESFLVDTAHITDLPSETAIFAEWKRAWQAGIQFGPPITLEYASCNGQGQKITCQQFAGARAEHYSATQVTNWFTASGQVKF